MTFAKITEKRYYQGESRTKEQENSKAIRFFIPHNTCSPIFIQMLNDFIVEANSSSIRYKKIKVS